MGDEKRNPMPQKAPHFVQITTLGWNRFDALVAWNSTCARLWTRLARSIDGQAVVVSTAVALATDLGVSAATVRRHLAYLETVRAFRRFRLPGGLTAFAMNPNEVWSGKTTARSRAPYCTGMLGGNAAGEATLRRGAWFLPGVHPTIPAVTPKARRPKEEVVGVENAQQELPFGETAPHAPSPAVADCGTVEATVVEAFAPAPSADLDENPFHAEKAAPLGAVRADGGRRNLPTRRGFVGQRAVPPTGASMGTALPKPLWEGAGMVAHEDLGVEQIYVATPFL